jgi:hypothetical protein
MFEEGHAISQVIRHLSSQRSIRTASEYTTQQQNRTHRFIAIFTRFFHDSYKARSWSRNPIFTVSFNSALEMLTGSRMIMFLGSRVRRVRRAVNLTAVCEPIV